MRPTVRARADGAKDQRAASSLKWAVRRSREQAGRHLMGGQFNQAGFAQA